MYEEEFRKDENAIGKDLLLQFVIIVASIIASTIFSIMGFIGDVVNGIISTGDVTKESFWSGIQSISEEYIEGTLGISGLAINIIAGVFFVLLVGEVLFFIPRFIEKKDLLITKRYYVYMIELFDEEIKYREENGIFIEETKNQLINNESKWSVLKKKINGLKEKMKNISCRKILTNDGIQFGLIVGVTIAICAFFIYGGLQSDIAGDELGYVGAIIGGGFTLLGVLVTILFTIQQQKDSDIKKEKHAASILYYDLRSVEDYLKHERSAVNLRYSENWQNVVAECSFISCKQVEYIYKIYDLVYNYNYFYHAIEIKNKSVSKEEIPQYEKLKELLFDASDGYIDEMKYRAEYRDVLNMLEEHI